MNDMNKGAQAGSNRLWAPVNKIIDNSIVDGPGNRTAVFFQGCNFDCTYCHNPETIHTCIGCGTCVALCPVGALAWSDTQNPVRGTESGKSIRDSGSDQQGCAADSCIEPGRPVSSVVPGRQDSNVVSGRQDSTISVMPLWNSDLCCGCDTCIKRCPHGSSPKITWMTPGDVEQRIKRNMPFIRGVTCSGGECTLQAEFITELFTRTKRLGLNNLLDSNGSMKFCEDELLQVTDGVMLDVKAFDESVHRTLTNSSNANVLENAVFLAQRGKLPEIRTVVIPDILPNEETVFKITRLLSPYLSISDIRYKLIKYRPLGVRQEYIYEGPDDSLMKKLEAIAQNNGFQDIVII